MSHDETSLVVTENQSVKNRGRKRLGRRRLMHDVLVMVDQEDKLVASISRLELSSRCIDDVLLVRLGRRAAAAAR